MELKIDQAFKKAIIAYQAGKLEEAQLIYSNILKSHPEHSDANHNLGILKLRLGMHKQSLPLFKKAIMSNPGIKQFWISYIEALKTLGYHDAAKVAEFQSKRLLKIVASVNNLNQIEDKDAPPVQTCSNQYIIKEAVSLRDNCQYDEAINHLIHKVIDHPESADVFAIIAHCYLLKGDIQSAEFYLNKASVIATNIPLVRWNLIRILLAKGKIAEALHLAIETYSLFPTEIEGIVLLASCLRSDKQFFEALLILNVVLNKYPSKFEALINRGLIMLATGDKIEALANLEKAFDGKSRYKPIWNLILKLKIEEQQYEGARKLTEKMMKIDTSLPELHFFLGLCEQNLGYTARAISSYRLALQLKENFAEANFNLAVILREQGDLDGSIEMYLNAIQANPKYSAAYFNLGNAYVACSKIDDAIESYIQALEITSDFKDCFLNLHELITNYGTSSKKYESQFIAISQKQTKKSHLGPMFIIYEMIRSFLENDLENTHKFCKDFRSVDPLEFDSLNDKNKVFCDAYHSFLQKLLLRSSNNKLTKNVDLYHLGDSHCLSFAHQTLFIKNQSASISPKLVLGAKAYHFSSPDNNKYKFYAKSHLRSMPPGSKVMLSFGEIDCRYNEGIIPASIKLEKEVTYLVDKTVNGYVDWFSDNSKYLHFEYYFLNVPAPSFDKTLSFDQNLRVSNVVQLFNARLEEELCVYGFNLIDVYAGTVGENGFSNGEFHIDKVHLGPSALGLVEEQLSALPGVS